MLSVEPEPLVSLSGENVDADSVWEKEATIMVRWGASDSFLFSHFT